MAYCSFCTAFPKFREDRYSIYELELLGVVWSVEHFKYKLYVKLFTVITDHRALLSIMRENRANKSYNSRLTRWVDSLLTLDFSIDHPPGSKMGLVDSREPYQKAVNISIYDEQFIVAKLDAIKRSAKRFLLNAENYIDFAVRNPLIKPASNNPHSDNQLCSEFLPRNREYSAITQNGKTISKRTPNNSQIPHQKYVLPMRQAHPQPHRYKQHHLPQIWIQRQ